MQKQDIWKDKQYFEDMRWASSRDCDLSPYLYLWVAIVEKKMVAAGEDPEKVEEEAMQKTGKKREYIPLIFVVGDTFLELGR